MTADQPTRAPSPTVDDLLTAGSAASPDVGLSDVLRRGLHATAELAREVDRNPSMVIARIVEIVDATLDPAKGPFPTSYPADLRLYASTSLINAGMVNRDAAALLLGAAWTTAAINDPAVSEPMKLAAEYNRANAYTGLVNIRARERLAADPSLGWTDHYVAARWEDRALLLQARAGLGMVGYDPTGQQDAQGRSTALCNLANTLNEFGRWLEAYDAYVDALEADPTNGNAAGNAAKLIGRLADIGWGDQPHLHALHDAYLARALQHRDRTVELAGEHAAQMWDALTHTDAERSHCTPAIQLIHTRVGRPRTG